MYPELRHHLQTVERAPGLVNYDERTCHRRPQTRQQEDAANAGKQALRGDDGGRRFSGEIR